jgi:hypothetical protein
MHKLTLLINSCALKNPVALSRKTCLIYTNQESSNNVDSLVIKRNATFVKLYMTVRTEGGYITVHLVCDSAVSLTVFLRLSGFC